MSDFETKYTQEEIENNIEKIKDKVYKTFNPMMLVARGPEETYSIGVGTVLKWTQIWNIKSDLNEQIILDSTGKIFTLPQGHRFKLTAYPKFGNSAGYRYYCWYDIDNATYNGIGGVQENGNASYNGHVPTYTYIDTKNGPRNFRVQVISTGATATVKHQNSGYVEIQQLDVPLFL